MELYLIDDWNLAGCLEERLDMGSLHVGNANGPRFPGRLHRFKALPGILKIVGGRNDIWIVP